jgi:hypothetical protein
MVCRERPDIIERANKCLTTEEVQGRTYSVETIARTMGLTKDWIYKRADRDETFWRDLRFVIIDGSEIALAILDTAKRANLI